MRAVLLQGHGGYEQLEVRDDVVTPPVGAGEVLVRIGAAGVNNTDINTRRGWYEGGGWTGSFVFPRIQGIDGCGVITEVGDGVQASRVGDRVLIEPCWRDAGASPDTARFLGSEVDGTFAEFCVVPSRHAHAVHSALADHELAAFPCAGSTALNLLRRAGVQVGERVIVTGASGGVGSMAVQLAIALGAEVTAVASPEKHDALRALGAAAVIDRDAAPAPASHDVAIDVVGGSAWPALLAALRPGGRYAVSGAVAGPLVDLDLRTLYLRDLTLFGATVLDDGVFAELVRHIETGDITPVIDATFPLDQIVAAQQRFAERRHVGKIVLTVAHG